MKRVHPGVLLIVPTAMLAGLHVVALVCVCCGCGPAGEVGQVLPTPRVCGTALCRPSQGCIGTPSGPQCADPCDERCETCCVEGRKTGETWCAPDGSVCTEKE
jgi:hypothetical protein